MHPQIYHQLTSDKIKSEIEKEDGLSIEKEFKSEINQINKKPLKNDKYNMEEKVNKKGVIELYKGNENVEIQNKEELKNNLYHTNCNQNFKF